MTDRAVEPEWIIIGCRVKTGGHTVFASDSLRVDQLDVVTRWMRIARPGQPEIVTQEIDVELVGKMHTIRQAHAPSYTTALSMLFTDWAPDAKAEARNATAKALARCMDIPVEMIVGAQEFDGATLDVPGRNTPDAKPGHLQA